MFPFNCNLSCAAFRCKGMAASGGRCFSNSAIQVYFALAGANGSRKSRIIRLCMKRGGPSILHPIGRLGTFSGVELLPKRDGRMSLTVPIGRFTCFSSIEGT